MRSSARTAIESVPSDAYKGNSLHPAFATIKYSGLWRSLVSARRLGRRGRRFESDQPDSSGH